MRVREWMTVEPATVSPATTVRGAAQTMASTGVRHLVVVEHDLVVGMLSDRDVLRERHEGADDARVTEVMSAPVYTIGPDEPISAAVRWLLSRRISALPVVDPEQHLLGIITSTDLLLALQPADDS